MPRRRKRPLRNMAQMYGRKKPLPPKNLAQLQKQAPPPGAMGAPPPQPGMLPGPAPGTAPLGLQPTVPPPTASIGGTPPPPTDVPPRAPFTPPPRPPMGTPPQPGGNIGGITPGPPSGIDFSQRPQLPPGLDANAYGNAPILPGREPSPATMGSIWEQGGGFEDLFSGGAGGGNTQVGSQWTSSSGCPYG